MRNLLSIDAHEAWLNRTVLGIALASLFSDWSHETATALLPAFLSSLGVAAIWLSLIEGVSDGLSSFAKLGSGYGTDRPRPAGHRGDLTFKLLVESPAKLALGRCPRDRALL